jgi:diketogulonate reductase-like aldo/keto reductase
MVVIPKTVTPSRITENLKATEIKLDAEDMKRLRELESKNFRLIKERDNFLVQKLQMITIHNCNTNAG